MHTQRTPPVTTPLLYYSTPSQDLSSALGEWLEEYTWDWWCTFTFRFECKPDNAKRYFNRFLKKLPDTRYYFMATEWHKGRSGVHVHALIGGVEGCKRLTYMDKWFLAYGIARIFAYDSKRGARYYLGKYLCKQLAGWDFELPLDKQLKMCYNANTCKQRCEQI